MAGSGGRGKRGSAGGALTTEPIGDRVAEERFSGLNDIGNLFTYSPGDEELNLSGLSANDAMTARFAAGDTNATAALAVRGADGRLVAADPVSGQLLASAAAANRNVNVVELPNTSGAREYARAAMRGTRPQFANVQSRGGLSDVGNLLSVNASEISTGSRANISQRRLDSTARLARSASGRAWAPIPVRQVGPDRYQAIGRDAANNLAIARRANVRPWIYITADAS